MNIYSDLCSSQKKDDLSRVVSISEASSIAIHSLVLIARSHENVNVNQLAERMGASKHHIAKIMQRLVKEGFLNSNRGPTGGFSLKIIPEQLSLLAIYESIEGPLDDTKCPLDHPICPFDHCLMGNIVTTMTDAFRKYMGNKTLADFI